MIEFESDAAAALGALAVVPPPDFVAHPFGYSRSFAVAAVSTIGTRAKTVVAIVLDCLMLPFFVANGARMRVHTQSSARDRLSHK